MPTTWSDSNLSKMSIKTIYMDQLRNAMKLEMVRRGMAEAAFTDPTLQPGQNAARKLHVQQLRDYIKDINGYTQYTEGDYEISMAKDIMRASHIQELRAQINDLENKPKVDPVSDCQAGCTGLCISCTATCTGSCVNSCATGCNNNCTGGCTGGCTGSCKGGCTSCSGCSGCSGCGPW